MVFISGLLYFIAYILTLFSKGNFLLMWTGIGLTGGISTGIGYLVSISVPVQWFPHKKGLITGIISAGFGGGAILHSFVAEKLFNMNLDVIQVMSYPSILYSVLILIISFFISTPQKHYKIEKSDFSILPYLKKPDFIRLFIGILTGTFAGLIVIGNLKSIGMSFIDNEITLASGIAILSVANFFGRLFWGWLADHAGAFFLLPFTLIFTGVTVFLITFIKLTP